MSSLSPVTLSARIKLFMKLHITQQKLIVATAVFLVASANLTFFGKVLDTYHFNPENLGLLLTLPLVLCGVLILLLSVLCYRHTCRPVLSLFILLGAISAYFTDRFGTVIDTAMIQNLLETNTAEAADLISPGLIIRFVVLGVIPTLIIWRLPLQSAGLGQALFTRLRLIGVTLAVVLASLFAFSSHYASFARVHKPLRYYINPTYPLYTAIKYLRHLGENDNRSLTLLGSDAEIPASDIHRELVVVVVGETARADHFSLNGYPRETNPLLGKMDRLFSYTDITACGTSTAVSVPCMFSNLGHDKFNRDDAKHQENVLDILQHAGVSVLWRDNNSDSKDVAVRVSYEDFKTSANNPICDIECRDEGMLTGLQVYIDKQPGDILIILHQMGNHGPAYYKRYPAAFERFKPACRSAELAACTEQEIINAYDNAILYTDYFLAKTIELLKRNAAYETVMLYVSDHGESLGEQGVFLHGMPFSIAPDAQTQVPLLVWLGENTDADMTTIQAKTKLRNSHDAVFHTLLNIFEIETDVLDKTKVLYDSAD